MISPSRLDVELLDAGIVITMFLAQVLGTEIRASQRTSVLVVAGGEPPRVGHCWNSC